jgi:hypothetical protein
VVKDGEGAQKFIAVTVSGAVSDASARKVGLAIANSPLVKTAIAGQDANWGRIVMAVGKAGEPADRDRLSIGFGGIWAAKDGQPSPITTKPRRRALARHGHRHHRRSGPWRRHRHRVDLRPDAWLHLDQRRLQELTRCSPSGDGSTRTM